MTTTIRPLLVELLTEELPPKALNRLGESFAEGVRATLQSLGLLADGCQVTAYATPRRLAVHLSAVLAQAPDQAYAEKLMPAKIGLTEDGKATPALAKKLAAKGLEHLDPATLERESDGKQDYLIARGTAPGAQLAAGLQEGLEKAIDGLPIPKVMRYQLADGQTSVKFVRPAHRLVALHGADIVPVSVLGLEAGRATLGHRFMSEGDVLIAQADAYEATLAQAQVVASFEKRRAEIESQLLAEAGKLAGTLGDDPAVAALLDEVTALVEHPTVYVGQFEEQFLQVPQECLILTMRLNQKYFPLFDQQTGKLTHRFLIVSNMRTANPVNIIEGNQRVVRPRLADAQFFFETDRKVPLAARVEPLGNIVYHNKLGTQLERVERVRAIARGVAQALGGNVAASDRAALLAKADLSSNMVGEFPELQGIMGAYYAAGDGEPAEVVEALRNQYRNRYDSPVTADTLTAVTLFLAERAETLTGIWAIGLAPTGERDPFGLRRAALGLISAFEQLAAGGWLKISEDGPLSLNGLLTLAEASFPAGKVPASTLPEVRAFIYERYRNQLIGEHDRNAVDAVIALDPPLHQVAERVRAVTAFDQMPEAASLAAANKRIGNLLKKAEGEIGEVDPARLTDAAEIKLASSIEQLGPQAEAQLAAGDFAANLRTLAQAREPVDAFFADVMVMAEDPALRANRLALLKQLHGLMNQVADISRLAQ
ncbi:glycine--tRNA ligase subunit beta [Bordetella avium]|uniref:glycine--tRNA ligase subunit beta n=1 Tax=Bordetella avium TaxID=521 RepID=UPI000E0A7590|nr:glycine--tRNA ligase subunit beta [Bordetella avium]RIQ13505.1 glycine--tRNA ligase subunit beta [Bordetella avium]RIQ16540.1 glycine--tRNA ligase subunit beta [Bordetella avium]RIQ31299.1 glycine--tRNA ligase subunit beta [Bordetella avium]RIQ36850.1 glycine--tRNA ligase subunit beta [Bordetella avium]RIQ40684.1 glycine--tRNA ligase subunit beta [Bordetella avium]